MSCKVQQSVCSDCVTYVKSRIKFNTFNTFNNVLDYYEVVTSKIFKLESMNEGLVLIAPEQEVDGVRSLMVGLYVPEHERYKMYTFRSSMNEGELGDKYKAMVGTMDVLKPDWDRIRKKRRKRT